MRKSNVRYKTVVKVPPCHNQCSMADTNITNILRNSLPQQLSFLF